MKRVIVELKVGVGLTMDTLKEADAAQLPGFTVDVDYEPVPVAPTEKVGRTLAAASQEVVLIRGAVEEKQEASLRKQPNVVGVWTDAVIEAFPDDSEIDLSTLEQELELAASPGELAAFDLQTAAPCEPTDCDANVPKGTIDDVARYLQCDRLWTQGIRGQGIVIGIVDSGVNQEAVPAVIDGWSPTPSYTPGSAPASSHGTMCAVDATGMCPDAKILDIALLQSTGTMQGFLSDAIAAYHWALNRYQQDGTPQILSNSWGMYEESWAPDYANDPNHPFTRKVVQVIEAGMIVTFAAGNCGSQCPSSRCGTDAGPGKSIWGANGHPRVITVGAANIREQWIGYTSQGPAALDPDKPDFCAPSHFKGARSCDNGTSAANPVCAGVIGLLKSHDPDLTQDKAKEALQKTAKNLCAPGWDPNSGYGMIQALAAYRYLYEPEVELTAAMWVHGTSVHEEYPDKLAEVHRMGPFALFEGNPGTSNWFHFPIPTPAVVDGKRLRLDAVWLSFLADGGAVVTDVHIYDGHTKIASHSGLQLTGYHWMERLDVPDRYVRRGVGISIRVEFGATATYRRVLFISAGGDFIT